MNTKIKYALILFCCLSFGGCGAKKENVSFEDDTGDTFFESVDKQANEQIKISKEIPLNQEFTVEYKTAEPDDVGSAMFKARSVKEIKAAGDRVPTEGNKLILVEISVRGNAKNKGKPTTFNQIGENSSPQFVVIDKTTNTSQVEETYYSDGYTESKKLFELSKITMDHETWVNTAIVFEVGSDKTTDLAFRFINSTGQVEFYDIKESTK